MIIASRQVLKTAQAAETYEQSWDSSRFEVTCTCPPSGKIQLRGGWVYEYRAWYVQSFPSMNLAGYTGQRYQFINPYWYTYWYFGLRDGHPPDHTGRNLFCYARWIYDWPGPEPEATEWETASEAEQAAMVDAPCYPYSVWEEGIPLGCVIWRNNGNITSTNEFLPIEPVNRGNSYLFKTHKHLKPRYEL